MSTRHASRELEIRGGGAVAVDTETLRHAAVRFLGAQVELEEVVSRLGSLQSMLTGRDAADADAAAWALAQRLRETVDEASGIAQQLRAAAAVYELVELNAAREVAFFAGDRAELERIDALRQGILADHPTAVAEAGRFEFERAVMWPSELVRQATETGLVAGLDIGPQAGIVAGAASGAGAILFGLAAGVSGQGRIGRDSRLAGSLPPVAVTPTRSAPTATTAPASLSAATSRIPSGSAARVRVEKYTMPDGSHQFAVYVAGTQTAAVGGDPWDAVSNVQLYGGAMSASYAATAEALDAAGARPGDVVHAFGFSQGAMVASHLALEGEYDTRTLVSFGSPVEADVGPGTLSVGIRHTDDPVAGLAGGGHGAPVGAPGSFIVETVADPDAGLHDVRLPAHRLTAYAETAALVDASADPRVNAVRSVFAELGTATAVEATEYTARRREGP